MHRERRLSWTYIHVVKSVLCSFDGMLYLDKKYPCSNHNVSFHVHMGEYHCIPYDSSILFSRDYVIIKAFQLERQMKH